MNPYSDPMTELGLFPLPLVLMPTERIPLHIFEPRYRELVGECIESGREFGFVLATGDGAVHEIGTRATVAQVLETLDEGELNIVVEGRERFRLLELTTGRSFTTGIVEPVNDADEPAQEADVDRALELFGTLVEVAETPIDMPEQSSAQLDFELAARVDFDVEAKQELLAMTSPQKRMRRLIDLLELALEATQIEQALRERAGQNGKVTPFEPE